MEITTEDILKDIEGFQSRVSIAREKLAMLPTGFLPYPEHKRREKQKRKLQAEVVHVGKLISIARENLPGFGC